MKEIRISVPDDYATALDGAVFERQEIVIELIGLALSEAAGSVSAIAGPEVNPIDARETAVELIDKGERVSGLARAYGCCVAYGDELEEIRAGRRGS
jgi:hypothetical protein